MLISRHYCRAGRQKVRRAARENTVCSVHDEPDSGEEGSARGRGAALCIVICASQPGDLHTAGVAGQKGRDEAQRIRHTDVARRAYTDGSELRDGERDGMEIHPVHD